MVCAPTLLERTTIIVSYFVKYSSLYVTVLKRYVEKYNTIQYSFIRT